MRTPLLAGNWKMYKGPEETKTFFKEFVPLVADVKEKDILFFVPFIDLQDALREAAGTDIRIGAQNAHWEKEGAYTGEISMGMLREIRCQWVLIGHSERRQYFNETNETTRLKIQSAFAHEIFPVLCVGESLEEREAGKTNEKVVAQVKEGLEGLSMEEAKKMTIAYEPIWAIGTGKTATSEDAQKVCKIIRDILRELFGGTADQIRILYGGSVKPDNSAELLAQLDIDGALVGGASLKAEDFAKIVKSC